MWGHQISLLLLQFSSLLPTPSPSPGSVSVLGICADFASCVLLNGGLSQPSLGFSGTVEAGSALARIPRFDLNLVYAPQPKHGVGFFPCGHALTGSPDVADYPGSGCCPDRFSCCDLDPLGVPGYWTFWAGPALAMVLTLGNLLLGQAQVAWVLDRPFLPPVLFSAAGPSGLWLFLWL